MNLLLGRDKKVLSQCLFVLMLCLPFSSYAATYTVSELLPTPLDIPTTVNTVTWDRSDTNYPNDDDKVLVSIGFPFTFKDVAYNQVRILTNGMLHFGSDQRLHRTYNNASLPTNTADRFIAPYWDDLVDDAQSSVTYGMKGSAPSRSFIVTWNNVRAYSNNLRYDFQVVLYENGDIRFRYDNNTANGISATIGIEVDNSDVIQYSYNSSSVRTDFDLFFKNSLLNLPDAVLDIRMDENEWLGDVDEVKDSSLNGLHGTVLGGALNSAVNPALAGNPGTCRYGEFNGTNQYINIPDNLALDLTGSFTVAAWIKIDSLPNSGLKTILSKDENYEFHVKPDGSIKWWWQTVVPNSTRQFDSTGKISEGVWTHVAIRFQANNQTIFLNGQASGSATFTGTPVTNNDPLQIGADQGAANREFNGDIDEVRVFDEALSDAQMITLASETHFCSLANPGCSAAFPDALSSFNDGTLTFTGSGQLVNSPDDVLQFSSISPAANIVCKGLSCSADPGNPVNEIDFGSFPDTTTFNQDLSISNNQTGTLGAGGQQQFDDVSVGNNATLNVNGVVSTYYIDNFSAGNSSEINLRPGDYWIRRLEISRDSKINVIGSGTARLFIKENVSFERNIWFNPNDNLGVTGDPSKLLVYGEGNFSFDRNIRAWAGIYSKSDIALSRDSLYFGALTADDISIEQNTVINYDAGAMSKLDFGSLCTSGSCNLGGFQITRSPSVALACPQSRAEIAYQAMCDDGVTPKTDYIGTILLDTDESALSQFYASPVGGSVVNSINMNGTESGLGVVYLYHQNENNTLEVSLEDQASSLTGTANIDFRTSGFAVSTPNSFACGGSENITITAIGQEDENSAACALLTGFSGDKNLSVWVQANYQQAGASNAQALNSPLVLNGSSISNSAPHTSTSLTANFSAGQATLTLEHLDAAQILSVDFAHDDGQAATPELRGTSGTFVVKPDQISMTALNDTCNANFASCNKFVSAGSPFSMTSTAVCADPAKTKASSYYSNGDISLSLNLVAPVSGGVNGVLSEGGVTITDADDGAITIANQKISEVGVFSISAQAPNFFGQTIDASTSANIGRFYPDYFDLSLTQASFQNECANFTYLDQPFFFNTAPQLTIHAKNVGGAITQNYEGDFWKLGVNLGEQSNCTISSGTAGFCYTDNVAGAASLMTPNSIQSYGMLTDINGQKVMTLHDQSFDDFTYSRPLATNVLPFDADVKLDILLQDSDGVTGSIALDRIGFASDSNTSVVAFNTTNDESLRHGRWRMKNAFGPETKDLAIQAHAEYFSTKSKFEFNPDDNCTALTATDISLNGANIAPISLGSGNTNFSFNTPLDVGENENFFLSAPGPGNTGNVNIGVDISSHPWLLFDWDQDGTLESHPEVRASFGQYRGHDRIIYWREIAN